MAAARFLLRRRYLLLYRDRLLVDARAAVLVLFASGDPSQSTRGRKPETDPTVGRVLRRSLVRDYVPVLNTLPRTHFRLTTVFNEHVNHQCTYTPSSRTVEISSLSCGRP